jgi:conjugal transfer pilus assembly protein TraD
MKNIYLRQRIAAILPWAVVASILITPGPMLLMLFLYKLLKPHTKLRKYYQYAILALLAANVISVLMLFTSADIHEILRVGLLTIPDSLLKWLLVPPVILLWLPLATLFLVTVGFSPADTALLEASKASQLTETTKVDNHNPSHIFVAGTTGSGKTTYLLNYILLTIQQSDDVYILSGKNGTNDSRSLLNVTRRIAARYGRTMYTVSLNAEEESRQPYNPLDGMSPTEAADALVEISEYTEPHYKACTSAWIKAVCEGLCAAEIPLSIAAICDFYDYEDFMQLLAMLVESGKISKEKQQEYWKLKGIAQEAALSKSRYVDLLLGDGASFFGGPERKGINASMARDEEAIFFADLDSFKYTDYTRAIGKLFIHDVRHMIATQRPDGWRRVLIMDELGAYATEQLMPIFAQARSQGFQIIVATQSIADLSAVSESFAERVLENCGQYIVMRLNSAADAETMANIIGTKASVETTHKSAGILLDADGAGTKKVVREYKVSPDMIKELPPLHAILYDKQEPADIKMLKVPFVEL